MLLRCIRAENKKLKHSIIFFACILIPVIPAIMGGFNYIQNTGILYLITGKLVGFSGFPPFEILIWLLRGTLAAIAIGALQLLLSMIIRSFSVPIGIALLGSIVGFLFSSKGLGYFCPYALMLMGMNSNKTEDSLQGGVLPFLLSTIVFFLLFSGCSIYILKKRDVRA